MADNPDPSSLLPDVFSPATRDWFLRAFKQPTAVQSQTWHVAARSEHALVIAPTGSGKTLAAFLYALDRLFREGGEDTREVWGSDQFWAEFVQPGRTCKPCVARGVVI